MMQSNKQRLAEINVNRHMCCQSAVFLLWHTGIDTEDLWLIGGVCLFKLESLHSDIWT